jgi:hypothetical protein
MLDQFLTRAATMLAFSLAALLAVVAAIVFFLFAGYQALLEVAPPPLAALGTGLVALAAAVLLVAVGRAAVRGARPPAPQGEQNAGSIEHAAAEMGGLAGAQMASLARANPLSAMAVSLLAGFAVGLSPRLRKTLLDIARPR